MKKIMWRNALFVIVITVSIIGCGEIKNEEQATVASNNFESPAYQEGLALVAKSNCLSCHNINESGTGPSYVSIAQKYANTPETIDLLSGKIINGSVGVWGQIPMTAHPNIAKEDAGKMVNYILLLKK